jgi:probable rRNA maturation factor
MKVRLQRAASVPPLKNRHLFLRFLRQALSLTGFADEQPGVLQFVLLSPDEMTELNALHLGHQGVTDVITYDLRSENSVFPAETEEAVLAEIYLCPELASHNAQLYGQSASRELFLCAVHGLLHLQGENDSTGQEKKSMREAEEKIMRKMAGNLDKVEFL